MHAAAYASGALDRKTKELTALAMAVTGGCDGCIVSHARGAARSGATDEEVAETLGVTIAMNGGPGDRIRSSGLRRVPGVRQSCGAGPERPAGD